MQDIKASKDEVIQILQTNRETHRTTFLKAQEEYRRRLIDELYRRLRDARNGLDVNHTITLPIPRDYTSEYDTVIRMLELHQSEVVKLSQNDVQCYIRDDWAWKREFVGSTSAYLNPSR